MKKAQLNNTISGTLDELRRVRNRHGGAPNEGDLVEAAKALNRLQEMYRFDVGDFVRGNIGGQQTGAELGVKDAFYLGRFAALNDAPGVALKWLEEAAVMATAEATTAAVANNTVQEKKILQALKGVERKLPPGFRDIDEDEVGHSCFIWAKTTSHIVTPLTRQNPLPCRIVMNVYIDWGTSRHGHGTPKSTRPWTTTSTTELCAAAKIS